MPLVSDSTTLCAWITEQSKGAQCVVDLGAGFFDKLRYTPPMARKIGIEVFPAYLGYSPPGVRAICGDILNWERLTEARDRDFGMLIDVIEHFPKETGQKLLRDLKTGFRKLIVMTPDGFVEQNDDVTGFENEYQIHECGWTREELEAEGFTVELKPDFHPHLGIGALFAVWERDR